MSPDAHSAREKEIMGGRAGGRERGGREAWKGEMGETVLLST